MDDLDGRDGSEAPSSSSDFYNTTSPHDRPHVRPPEDAPVPERVQATTSTDDQDDVAGKDEDSSSEMDLSVSSRASSPEPEPEPHTGAKRRLSATFDNAQVADELTDATEDLAKRRRVSAGPSPAATGNAQEPAELPELPVEIWQHILSYLPPAMLCRLLRVSRSFKAYLTETVATPAARGNRSHVCVLDSEAIWTQARKIWLCKLPRPLPRCTELQMLQLIGGKTCQFCNRAPVPSPATTVYNSGPGPDGCRVIWSFGIRACGRCIEGHTLTDIQILQSPASSLRKGISYIYLTPDLNLVPEMQRQMPGGIPASLRVTRRYYQPDSNNIIQEYENAKTFGDGAAQEWRNGLETLGKEAMADAARWEKWESQMQLGSDLSQVLREYDLSSFPKYTAEVQSRSAGASVTQLVAVTNGTNLLSHPVRPFQNGHGPPLQLPNIPFQPVPKPARNPHQVEEIRAARRADIKRRCLELEPPLEPSILQHVESFRAAMQITTPMTDAAWEMLKPRILAQREAAELFEHQRAEQLAALQAAIPATMFEEYYTKPAKDASDKKYEHAQEPLRKKLSEYADECINLQWNEARGLDHYNSPEFAVSVMSHVRQRYAENQQAGSLTTTEQPAKEGSKQDSPVPDPFLSLDNMKWVYDNKIRPLTDGHRRELFICAGCADERKPKWYAFEGLIQHYGAKHTPAFSKGNVVVHWPTAEWPDSPPFHPKPSKWINMERRVSDKKGHGCAGNTPQNGLDGPFAAPTSGKLLSESPFFSSHTQPVPPASNGFYNPPPGYQPYQRGQTSPQGSQFGFPNPTPTPAQPPVDLSYDAQLNKLSSDASEIWEILDGVKELLTCVRVQTVLHHVVVRFTERFHQRPTLDLVTDALALNPLMRSVKNAPGMACKICVASQTDGSANYQSYYARISKVKVYNASSLISHYKIVHHAQEYTGLYDWARDMIELPETQLISDLVRASGMDDDKLALVAAAFPAAFSTPLPKIGTVQEPADNGLAHRLLDRFNKKSKQTPKKKGQLGTNGTTDRDESQEPLPEPKEDEYDPRRPMNVKTEEQTADPARFDTDIARRASASTSPLNVSTLDLTPETVLALSNLTALTSQHQRPQADSRGDRSPSVGRADLPSAPPKPVESSPNTQLDIAAILASLTGHQQPAQPANPATTVSAKAGSALKHPHADSYGQPPQVSPRSHPEEKRPSSRYTPQQAHRASAEPAARYDELDLQAALSRNARYFDHNRTQTYVEPSSTTLHHHSPARYRVVYDDGQPYSQQPSQQAPVYHGAAPIQYIQLPAEHERLPLQSAYQYEQRPAPAPKPVYIDKYGRPVELIPIDNAPAPVQYAPHPYEQQQQQQAYARPAMAYTSVAPPQPAVYEDRRAVYYEPATPGAAPPTPAGSAAQEAKYVYDEGARSSVSQW